MTRNDDERLDDWLAGRGDGRAVVVVAHPDDEVLGCGALLTRLHDVVVVHVTNGAPRDGGDARRHGFASPALYAAARAREARAALLLAGVGAERVSGFDLVDQEAPLHLAATVARLVPLLDGTGLVLTHAFEGGHGDHDGVAFAVRRAWDRLCAPRPLLVEMPFYHAEPDGWRRQNFLPQTGAGREHRLDLSEADQALKRSMAAAHGSQSDTLQTFDLATERYRLAPRYDFVQRPHGGDLLYERHGWKLDWPGWVERVRGAEIALGKMVA